jgi:hypothetical protein
VLRKEVDERGYCVEPESVVGEVNRVEFRECEQSRDKVGEGGWDLRQQTAGEYVGKVCDLVAMLVVCFVLPTR